MPLARDDAICLRVTPFGETSQVASVLCREHGRVKLLAKGARRRTKAGKGKFDGGMEPLDLGHALFAHVPERDLSPMTEWKLLDGHRALRRDLRAMWLGLYAAELVDRLIEEHDPHPRLFDGLLRLFARLTEPTTREAVALAFVLNLIRQAGILPDFGRTSDGTPTRRALAEGDVLSYSPGDAALYRGDEGVPGDAIPANPAALEAILGLLRLARNGGDLPTLQRPEADGAHKLLAAHLRAQTDARLRVARFIFDDAAGRARSAAG